MTYSLKFSSRFRIPVLSLGKATYYPWHLRRFISARKRRAWVKEMMEIDEDHLSMVQHDWDWIYPSYLPLSVSDTGSLILDVGAGCGETTLFFRTKGYTNIRAVEPDQLAAKLLRKNGFASEVREKRFSLDDLDGVTFAKSDSEGGEAELLKLSRLPCEMVVSIHKKFNGLEEALLSKFPNHQLLNRQRPENTYRFMA